MSIDSAAPELDLPSPRTDLPDSLRPLTAMHDAMRRDAARLQVAVAARPEPATAAELRSWFGLVTGVILHHHRCEDEILWPAIERWVPDFAESAAHLVDDHHELDAALDGVAASLGRLAAGADSTGQCQATAVEAAARFEAVLDRHLTAEEATVIPAIRDHVPPASFAETEEEIGRTGTLRFAAFALPWVLDGAEPRSAAVILEDLPLPFRLLHRWVWVRRYRRASMHV